MTAPLSADAPARVQQEARQILDALPPDRRATAHRREMAKAMFDWKVLWRQPHWWTA